MPGLPDLLAEANRQLTICNACRYCEGYCAVFPALERRSVLREGDLALLANLCHDCRACYQACMYTPPHEFGVNVPALLSQARLESYRRYAWPGPFASLFEHPRWAAAGASLVVGVLSLVAVVVRAGVGGLIAVQTGPGAFYRLIAYEVMVAAALTLSAAALTVLVGGFYRLWREAGGSGRQLLDPRLWAGALGDAAVLRYLRGGGGGCHYPDPSRPRQARLAHHHVLLAGFALALAATVAAAVEQDVLGLLPPYPILSPPVLLGLAGGLGVMAGAGGLLAMKRRELAAARELAGPGLRALDVAFLILVESVAVTGLLLLVLRATPAMGPLLVAHLGAVGGLFLTAPYGKFVHAVHRLAALLRERAEAAEGR
jgi:citrate/tricarballylate utilization protein